jgi:hypothetical protein
MKDIAINAKGGDCWKYGYSRDDADGQGCH